MASKIVLLALVNCVISNSVPDASNFRQSGVTSDVEQRLNALELKYGEELKSQKKKIAELEKQLAASKCEDRVKRQGFGEAEVAFHAYITDDLTHIGSGQIVVFDHVVTNIDSTQSAGGYSSSTGVFRAPVSGLYVFDTHLVGGYSHTAHFVIYKGDTPVVATYLHGNSQHDWDTTSTNMIVSLVRGETVSVRHTDTDHALEGTYLNAGQSMFSGFLLRIHDDDTVITG